VSIVLDDDWLTVHHGDARAVLPTLEAASVDAVVTSPPYWRQRAYLAPDDPLKPLELGSEETFDEWVANLAAVCHELQRVLKQPLRLIEVASRVGYQPKEIRNHGLTVTILLGAKER